MRVERSLDVVLEKKFFGAGSSQDGMNLHFVQPFSFILFSLFCSIHSHKLELELNSCTFIFLMQKSQFIYSLL